MNETQVYAACIRCGKPAPAHGEHHAVEKGDGSTGPKGMGGSSIDHEHERVVLCRKCHNDTHASKFMVVRNSDGLIACVDPKGKILSLRAGRETEEGADSFMPATVESSMKWLLKLSDAALAYVWGRSDENVYRALVGRALTAYAFHERYGSYGEKWYDRVSEVIRDQTGAPVHRREVYRMKAIGDVLVALGGDPIANAQILGRRLMKTIGESSSITDALALAIEGRDAGERMDVVTKSVRAKYGRKRASGTPKCETTGTHVCRFCAIELEETSE